MKETIQSIFVIIGLIVTTILGIYGQDISYFINDQISTIDLRISITIVTFLSIGLYIFIPILLFISNKVKKVFFWIYLTLSILIGLPTSGWSFFVWAMWMG
ncbi:hypothetical protein [Oceanobacillus picturae]|nr:hypothetical protein [Oceanobacillus picturae]RIU92029.1 hypothetical protein D1864_10425 [Oceanobacillus picturae]